MEIYIRGYNLTSSEAVVKRKKFYYLDLDTRRQLDQVLQSFLFQPSGNGLWQNLCERLPLNKLVPEAQRLRAEGLYYVSECLWSFALQGGKKTFGDSFDRAQLRRTLRVLPMSHYHYLMGSRERRENLLTRHDALQDPGTAIAKLQQDIDALAGFIKNLSENSAQNTNPVYSGGI